MGTLKRFMQKNIMIRDGNMHYYTTTMSLTDGWHVVAVVGGDIEYLHKHGFEDRMSARSFADKIAAMSLPTGHFKNSPHWKERFPKPPVKDLWKK